MYAKDYAREDPFCVTVDDTLWTAIDRMLDSHQLDLWVVDEEGRFVGQIRAFQFAKMLVPVTVGSHCEIESAISDDESVAESLQDAKKNSRRIAIAKSRTSSTRMCRWRGPTCPLRQP